MPAPPRRQPDQVILDATWSAHSVPLAQRRPLLVWLTRHLAWTTASLTRHLALGAQHALIAWATWMWQPHLARSIAASRRAHRAQHRAHRASRRSAPATYAEHADELTRRAREIDRMRRDLWRARGRRLAVTAALITLTTVVPWLLPAWQPWPRAISAGMVVVLLAIIGRYVRHEHAIDAEPEPQAPTPEPPGPQRNLTEQLARHLPAVGIRPQKIRVRAIPGGHAAALALDGATITDVRRRLPEIATRLMVPLRALVVVADPRDPARLTLEVLDQMGRHREQPPPPPAPDIVEHVASTLAGVDPGMWTEHLVPALARDHGQPYGAWAELSPDRMGRALADALKPHGIVVDRLPRMGVDKKQRRGVLTADVLSVLRGRRNAA
jgi:hypothetical protein